MMNRTKKIVTYDNVVSAAKALVDSAKRPSVRAVITTMGGGSPNEVGPLLLQWKKENPVQRQEELVLDPGISVLISKQIKAACDQAVESTQAELEEMQADSVFLARAGKEAEEVNAQLHTELEQARAQVQHLTGRLEAQAIEIDKAREIAIIERQATDGLRMEMVRAQTLAEAVPKLEAEIVSLNLLMRSLEVALAQAQTEAAVATAKFEAQLARAEDCIRQRDLMFQKGVGQ